jgi:hypothetical protein
MFKNSISLFTLALVGAGALAVTGCDRDDRALAVDRDKGRAPGYEAKDEPRAPAVAPGMIGATVDRIAEARCKREARCNNIGADEDFKSHDACLSSIREKTRDDLNASDCPGGIDQKELNECLEEINNDSCNNPLDTLGRLAACRSSDMCKATR